MEKVNWRTVLYFLSTKWKTLTGEIDDFSCPQNGEVEEENSIIFHIHEVEKFNWRALLYFMSTKWKSLTGELYYISCL